MTSDIMLAQIGTHYTSHCNCYVFCRNSRRHCLIVVALSGIQGFLENRAYPIGTLLLEQIGGSLPSVTKLG